MKGSDSIQDIMKAIKRDKSYYDNLPETSKRKKQYSKYNFERLDPIKISRLYLERRGITPYQFIKTDFSRTDLVYKERYLKQEKQSLYLQLQLHYILFFLYTFYSHYFL